MTGKRVLGLLVVFVLFGGCAGERWPEGLRRTPAGTGPVITWDLNAKPFPDVPFPNDIGTRLDPSSPTGRRVNVSLIAPTQLESGVRRKIDQLTGFGTYAAFSVSFSDPLDIGNILQHHKADDIRDDTVLLININPKSPEYGRAMPIDLGDGNFPYVLPKTDNYFENDPDAGASSIVFNNLNTNPAVSSDPDRDLLTFYERATNTLIMRPILPLEEESLYAVVLTNKLIGESGQPVRSPFPYINHLSQTESLRPLVDILPRYGLTINDVAFVWDFTTQSTTRDMVAVRKGIYGRGPLGWLSDQFPGTVDEVLQVNTFTDSSHFILKTDRFLNAVKPVIPYLFGEIPTQDVQAVLDGYNFVNYFVAGEFETPYFLTDKDGMAAPGFPDDENEFFDVDPMSGHATVGPSKVPFWCAIPKEGPWGHQPFPVVFYSHGYTGFKLEMLGFAGSLAKFGLASCAIDAVGHGVCLDKGTETLLKGFLNAGDVGPVYDVFAPARARDLNNDGVCESGGDFWTADTFHTRDIVRQSVIDHMQLIRTLRGFDGSRTWRFDPSTGMGGAGIAGDFNGDGVPDIGGPGNDYYSWGISLGGILSSDIAGAEPAIVAASPVSGGSGLADIAVRSVQGGVVEAVFLRIMGPFVVGSPVTIGTTDLKFMTVDVNRLSSLPFARVTGIAEGDRIIVKNTRSGKEYEATATSGSCYDPDNSNHQWRAAIGPCFRVSFAADAVRAGEKRVKLGLTLDDTIKGIVKPIANPLDFGDHIIVEIRDGTTGQVRQSIDTFGQNVDFQGGRYLSGTPLVAPAEGFGLKRLSVDLRKFFGVSEIILEPGDPVTFAPHYHQNPLNFLDVDPGIDMGANVLDIVTVGDMNVPVNTGINTARAAGMIPLFQKDLQAFTVATTTGGMLQTFTANTFSPNDILLKGYVIEGLFRLNRFTDSVGGLLLDVDNLAVGHDFTGGTQTKRDVPRLYPPLRITVPTKTGVAGMRIPYMKPTGQHGFDIPHPSQNFDIDQYMINLIGRYFQSRGTEILDDPCLEMTGRYGDPYAPPCSFPVPPP